MGAGDRVKQFGRTDQPRPLVDRADSPCEQLLPRRSCSAFSGGYSLAEPQPLLVAFGTCRAKCAWRSAVSMRISMRKQRRAAGRPGALPNLRRICGHKTGVPTPQKGVRCGRPTVGVGCCVRSPLLHMRRMPCDECMTGGQTRLYGATDSM